eukprot:g3694.t1
MLRLIIIISLAALASFATAQPPPGGGARPKRPNVLYLMADDMRPQLGCYGHAYMKTPFLDGLAQGGTLFETAFTQFAYCAPSRNSFMSGRRPERTKALNFLTDFRRQHGKSWVSMPEFFKNAGYFTSAAGKLYHDGMDDPLSWSYPSNQTRWIQCKCHMGPGSDDCDTMTNYCRITRNSSIGYTDEDLVLLEGLKRLDAAHASGKPWFVGIGVHRPHWASRLPDGFYGPQVYPDGNGTTTSSGMGGGSSSRTIGISGGVGGAGRAGGGDVVLPPKHPLAPVGAPWMSGNWYGGDYKDPAHGCPSCAVPSARSVEYRRWYYAAVTYADHMLGKALSHLDSLGVANETIVVFHADHGYQVSELRK